MKKLLWIVVAMMMFLIPCTSYGENNLSDTLAFFEGVGINMGYETETVKEKQEITRAVFADKVATLLNMKDRNCDNVYYHDVSRDYWAFNVIGVLTESRFLSGDGQNNFNPDNIMTKEQAIKVLVSALGYDVEANLNGGYPNGYMNIAYNLELLDGCSGENNLILSDMLIMFKNALNAEISTYNQTFDEEQTLMGKYHDIYYDKGTLTGCDNISITSDNALSDGIVVIDGFEYSTELRGIVEYIGTEVEFLYKADEADDTDRELVWINSRDKNDIIDIEKNLYSVFDKEDYILTWYDTEASKERDIKIDTGILVIYNGELVDEDISNLLNSDRYHARFIKTKDSSKYNIAVIESYKNFVVGNIDKEQEIIYDKIQDGRVLSYGDSGRDRVEFANNVNIDAIKVGDVLCVYESKSGKYLKIDVSQRFQQITAIQILENEITTLQTADESFEFYEKKVDYTVGMGDVVKLYFDVDGYVAHLEPVSKNNAVAYLINAYYDEDNDWLSFKILNSDGSITRYSCAERMKLDEVLYKSRAEVMAMLCEDGEVKEQVIVMSANSKGEITKIDTQEVMPGVEDEENSLREYMKINNQLYRGMGRFGAKIAIDDKTIIFSVPETKSDNDEDYTIKYKSNLTSDLAYNAIAYRYTEENLDYEDVLLTYKGAWTPSVVNVLVDSINSCVNSDGEVVEGLKGNQGGKSVTYLTDGVFSVGELGAKSGDIVSIELNSKGEICEAEIEYVYGSGILKPANSHFNATNRQLVAYAHDKAGNILKVGYESPDKFDELFITVDSQIVIYNPQNREKIRPGTIWDIKTYKNSQSDCSLVAVQTFTANTKSVIVYE